MWRATAPAPSDCHDTMTIAKQNWLEAGRQATREQLLRVLLRSHARQHQVARRRIAWRMAQRSLIIAIAALSVLVATYWALRYSGVIPGLAIIVDAGEPLPVAAPLPTPAPAPSPPTPIQPEPEASATQESLGLKLDTQLKALVRVGYPL